MGGAAPDPDVWPLVGRDDECSLAIATLARGRGVVLIGSAGVGKTRLAAELVERRVRTSSERVAWIRATRAAANVPLGAAAHLVPPDAVTGARDNTLQAITATLAAAHDGARLLLAVDDAHFLDDASAVLVHQMATTGAASVIATVRSGVRVPDAITALWRDEAAMLIALQPLLRAEVRQLLTTELDGPVGEALLQMLWELTAGNPLYLKELVRHGRESGALRTEGGLWRWTGDVHLGDRLQELIGLRMGELAPDELIALELIALGEPLPSACVRNLGVADVIERLERRGLVASHRNRRVELGLAHPMFGEVLRSMISPSRVESGLIRLADAMDDVSAGDPADELRIALWRVDAGDHRNPEQLRAAARRAWALWSAPVAERLARAALTSGLDFEAGHLLAEALSDMGRSAEAVDVWESVAHLPSSDRQRAIAAHGHASILHFHLGRTEEAGAVLRRALGRVTDPAARRHLEGSTAMFAATSGRRADATSRGDPLADDETPSLVLATAIESLKVGAYSDVVTSVERSLAGSAGWADEFPTLVVLLHQLHTWALLLRGDVNDAALAAERGWAGAVAEHADYPRSLWGLTRGVIAAARGKPEQARGSLLESIALMSGTSDPGWLRPMHAHAAIAAAVLGDAPAAQAHLDAAASVNRNLDGVFGVDVRRAAAWSCAARGELSAAIAHAQAAADHAAIAGQPGFELLALHDLVRFGDDRDVVAARMTELAARIDGRLAPALAAHARATIDADADSLDSSSIVLSAIGIELVAAEASTEAARLHRRAGRRAPAFVARQRAAELCGRCEGASTPALAVPDAPDDLTSREREVAALARSGCTSREIGETLGITTRTVDNLLGRVYLKLGLSGRRQLIDVFDSGSSDRPRTPPA